MEKELRILVLEDVAADVVLLNRELRRSGLTFRSKRVETREAFLQELAENPPDLILSDHGLPSFDGFAALALAGEKCPDVPFVFVSGSLGHEVEAQSLPRKVAGVVHKNDLRDRLMPVITGALAEARERQRTKVVGQALQERKGRFLPRVDLRADFAVCTLDDQGLVVSWNPAAESVWAYRAEQIIGRNFSCFYPPEEVRSGRPRQALQTARDLGQCLETGWRLRKDGGRFFADVVINVMRGQHEGLRGFSHVAERYPERGEIVRTEPADEG